MKVKIDTKEKFYIIEIKEPVLSANMTEELSMKLLSYLHNHPKNVVLKLTEVKKIDNSAAQSLLTIQQEFYNNNASFVITDISKSLQQLLDGLNFSEALNITRTESEAWDIVQMEEIERELDPNP